RNSGKTAGRRSASLFARSDAAKNHEAREEYEGVARNNSNALRELRVLRGGIFATIAPRSNDRVQELGLSSVRSHRAHRHDGEAGLGSRGLLRPLRQQNFSSDE